MNEDANISELVDKFPELSTAFSLLSDDEFAGAFSVLVDCYNKSGKAPELYEIIYNVFCEPNLPQMKDNFSANIALLNHYPYKFGNIVTDLNEFSVVAFPVSECEFSIYDKNTREFSEIIVYETSRETKYFFKNVSKPLFVEGENNFYNLQFLYDNVRRSEDFGGDNHIYLYYDNFEALVPLLAFEDFEPILADKKFVFLFGEKNRSKYPINFRKKYNIDYSKSKPQPVRIDEIKRLCIFYSTNGHCGNAFVDSLIDFHPNLLTIKEFGLSAFHTLYEECLKGRSCEQFLSEFLNHQQEARYKPIFTFFNRIYPASEAALPDSNYFIRLLLDILKDIAKPNIVQWFCAFYLANSLALHRNINNRIVPMIFYSPHIVWGCDWNNEIGKMQEVFDSFPYVKVFSVLRRPASMIGGEIKYSINCNKLYGTNVKYGLNNIFHSCESLKNIDWRRVYHDENSYFDYNNMAVLRYEDIKTNPKASMYSLCEYFDIPWSDMMLKCTHNGAHTIYNDAGTKISDFDKAPLAADYYSTFLNNFDVYRIELLYSNFYRFWNYKPQNYDLFEYSENEIVEMFEKPFAFEGTPDNWCDDYVKERQKQLRENLPLLLQYLKNNDTQVRNGLKKPCRLLVPKSEFCVEPIYE